MRLKFGFNTLDGLLPPRIHAAVAAEVRWSGGAFKAQPGCCTAGPPNPGTQPTSGVLHVGHGRGRESPNSQRSTHSTWKRWPHCSTRIVSPLEKSSVQIAHARAASPPRAICTAPISSLFSNGGCGCSASMQPRGARAGAHRSSAMSCFIGHARNSSVDW